MMKQTDFRKTVQNLMLLDTESLLLIDSGVKLLLARQYMEVKSQDAKEIICGGKNWGHADENAGTGTRC